MFFDAELYLEDLKSRFDQIDKSNYYLAYSGGRDSHFLYWFIKEYLKDDEIEIVSVNTRMEHPEILKRMRENADIILLPEFKPHEIKEKFGSPCFTKDQDNKISRYQRGSRAPSTMNYIFNYDGSTFNISKYARNWLLSGKLHKVTDLCCWYLKEKPMIQHGKKHNKKSIQGVRGSESRRRKAKNKTCFNKKGDFKPLYDLNDELLKNMELKYNIEIPKIYDFVCQTGCMGCVYGRNIESELKVINNVSRLKYVINLFKESYDVKKINYKKILEDLINGKN